MPASCTQALFILLWNLEKFYLTKACVCACVYVRLEHCCEDLIAFSWKSIGEVRYWQVQMIRSGSPTPLQVIPNILKGAPSLRRIQLYCFTAQYREAFHSSNKHLALSTVTLGSCAAVPQHLILLAMHAFLWRLYKLCIGNWTFVSALSESYSS